MELGIWTEQELADAIGRFYESGGEHQWLGGRPNLAWLYIAGRAHGYPECCIKEFVSDCAADRMPAQLRGVGPDGCVPCSACAR